MNFEVQPWFFETQSDFRKWLEENHNNVKELFVGFYKVGSGKKSMNWSESVDQALCFGWIDGVRKSIDKERYFIRFTPRKPKSIWSAVNLKKVEELTMQGLMRPAGLTVFDSREEGKFKTYSYEKEEVKLSDEFEEALKFNEKAWAYFQSMPQSYKKPVFDWLMSAKQEATRVRRLQELIRDSEAGRKIKRLSY